MATKNTYADLLKKKEELDAQIEAARSAEIEDAITRAREIIDTYELTPADLGFRGFGGAKKSKRLGPAPVRYKDKKGNTWSGRGPRPHWLREALEAGKTLESFYVGDATE